MSNIPWSAGGERRLRNYISFLGLMGVMILAIGAVSIAVGLILPHHRFWMLGGLVFFLFFRWIPKMQEAVDYLGWEETSYLSQRIPGSGMLANKPRDTSRLTRWRQWRESEGLGPLGFTCACGRPHDWTEMKWTANVLECEKEFDDVPAVAVDPGGGRWVLICSCGIGHYSLDADLPGVAR